MDDKYNEQLLIQTVNYISHLLGIDPIENDDPETLHYTWVYKDGDCLATAIFSFTIKNRETDLDCWVILDCLPLKDTRDRNFHLHSSLTKENEKEIYEWLTPAMDKIYQKAKNRSSSLSPESSQKENMKYYMRCIDCGKKWFEGDSILEDNQGNIFCSEECVLHFYGVNQDETKLCRTEDDDRAWCYEYDHEDFNEDDEEE